MKNSNYRKLTAYSVLIGVFVFLTACSDLIISTPYKQIASSTAAEEYLVVVTYAEYRTEDGADSRFADLVSEVRASLEADTKVHGYSIRRDLFSNRAWTYTVWETRSDMEQFKFASPHASAMGEAPQVLETASFAQTVISTDALPFDWDQALMLLQEEGRNYSF